MFHSMTRGMGFFDGRKQPISASKKPAKRKRKTPLRPAFPKDGDVTPIVFDDAQVWGNPR